MRVEKGVMVALGYGKYFRSDSIVGLEPIEEDEGRGPGRRTLVYVQNVPEPRIASKSESTILRDMVEMSDTAVHAEEQRQLLIEILETVQDINPMLRTIVREQGKWDLNLLERRIRHALRDE